MGGITIAHQPTETEDNFTNSLKMDKASEEQLNQLLASSGDWQENVPMVEDLTGEVQDLMLRESVGSWLQPWTGEGVSCLADFNAQLYAQSIQLEDLFGQDELANFSPDMLNNESNFYDEISFVPDDASLTMSAPTTSSSSSASSPADISYQASPVVQFIQPPAFDDIVQVTEEVEIKDQHQIEIVENSLTTLQVEEEELQIEEEEQVTVIAQTLKRRRSSCSSDSSSDDSSDGSSDESDSEDDDVVIPTTVANMSSRRGYSSSDSDSESDTENVTATETASSPVVSNYMYMHKRQVEEALLDKITNHLQPEKLPGILSILSTKQQHKQEDDEVEIDLSCLERELLVQLLSYVDACILEQNGGPTVRVEDYIIKKKKGPRTRPALQQQQKKRAPRAPKARSRAELTEDLNMDSSDEDDESDLEEDNLAKETSTEDGPISMASLSKKTEGATKRRNTQKKQQKPKAKRNRSSAAAGGRRKKGDTTVSSSVTVIQDPDSIASSRPKRRAALHKRRLLEKMLAPSDDDSDDDEMTAPETTDVLVVFSDEQMDLRVVDNQTIAHTSSCMSSSDDDLLLSSAPLAMSAEEEEDDDDEIDIMC
ncbi:hypothetical protein K501DRAFT_329681 [Backusella circina FSU 941]|nr:hypothetical protein K501DRAFT_329681 [Backusella circina FSU 941]